MNNGLEGEVRPKIPFSRRARRYLGRAFTTGANSELINEVVKSVAQRAWLDHQSMITRNDIRDSFEQELAKRIADPLSPAEAISSTYHNHRDEGADVDIRLIPTGQQVHSVTSVVDVAFNEKNGEAFLVKPIIAAQAREAAQLAYLRSKGISVPNTVFVSDNLLAIATPNSGITLDIFTRSVGHGEARRVFFQAGALLRRVHQLLEHDPPTNDTVSTNYQSSAHIVDSFFYKHSAQPITPQSYQEYKESIAGAGLNEPTPEADSAMVIDNKPFIPLPVYGNPELIRLISFANELAAVLLNKLSPYVRILPDQETGRPKPFLGFVDTQLFEGDYKQENLLIRERGSGWEVVIIDPVISRGTTNFDLAKFTARSLLTGQSSSNRDLISRFFDGYVERPADNELAYGPLSFGELVEVDLLNILRSYIKRLVSGDKKYSLVRALDSEEFCLETRHLIEHQVV